MIIILIWAQIFLGRFCRFILVFGIVLSGLSILSGSSEAELRICNKSLKPIDVALGQLGKHADYVTNGWWAVKPGACSTLVDGDLTNKYYFYYARRSDGKQWYALDGEDGGYLCVTDSIMNDLSRDCNGPTRVKFKQIDTGGSTRVIKNLSVSGEILPNIQTGAIQERCLISYDDSHQVHSVDTIIEWNYQAVKTTMKKLSHCIKLTVDGPVNVENIAKSYIDYCVQYALNDGKSLYLFKAIVALGVDILSQGATGGGATAAAVTDYVVNVQEKAVACLMDEDQIEAYLADTIEAQFDATVQNESHWVYWQL